MLQGQLSEDNIEETSQGKDGREGRREVIGEEMGDKKDR